MGKDLYVKLIWKGPYNDPDEIREKAGIYMVIAITRDKVAQRIFERKIILDIGQTGEGSARFDNHGREDEWEDAMPFNSKRIYKFAPMTSDEYDVDDRRAVECCLRWHEKPECGKECNEEYNKDVSVKILNEGNFDPLDEKYLCPGT